MRRRTPPRSRSLTPATAFAVAGAIAMSSGVALAQHDADFAVMATAAGGGQLTVVGDTATPIFVQPSFCAAGTCLYAATDPGFVSPTTASGGRFPVASGSAVRLEIVALDAGAAIKVGATVLDAPGESAALGTAPSVHVHPSWQVTAPQNAAVQRTASFRLTASGSPHAASSTIVVTLQNFEATTTTTTTTSSTSTTEPTTTSTIEPVCGDGLEGGDEQCDQGEGNGDIGVGCRTDCTPAKCGDPDHSGATTAADALFTLRAAVGATTCAPCACDAQPSTNPVTAGDALLLLKKAVGQAVNLSCPACG